MKKILDMKAKFTWFWSDRFFVETEAGNFVWSDPSYNGDNTLTRFDGDIEDFCETYYYDFGRDKGEHLIKDYCGSEVVLAESTES